MFATDHLHYPDNPGPLYGSIPYVSGLTANAATGLLWVNSAKTTIDIDKSSDASDQGMTLTYASEANSLEFFMISSAYVPSSSSASDIDDSN